MLRGVAEHRDPEKLELYLAETSPANRFGVGLVAEVDGKAVGFVAGAGIAVALSGLDVSEEDITRRIGLLDILAVHPDYQRRGIGALLCTTLLDRFRDTGQRLVVAKLANGRRDLIPIYAVGDGAWAATAAAWRSSWAPTQSSSLSIQRSASPGRLSRPGFVRVPLGCREKWPCPGCSTDGLVKLIRLVTTNYR